MRMLILGWLVLLSACAQSQPIPAATACRGDKILNAAGLYITLVSGQAFQGYPGSQPVMSSWLPQDKVTVCRLSGLAVQITDLSRRGETVKALRIYPSNTGALI